MKKRVLSLLMVLVFIFTLLPSTIVPTFAGDVEEFIGNVLAEDLYLNEYNTFTIDSDSETHTFSYDNVDEGKYVLIAFFDNSDYDYSKMDDARTTIKFNGNELADDAYSTTGLRSEIDLSANETYLIDFSFENLEGVKVSLILKKLNDLTYIEKVNCPSSLTMGLTEDMYIYLPEECSKDSEIRAISSDTSIVKVSDAYKYYSVEDGCCYPVVQYQVIPISEGSTSITIEFGNNGNTNEYPIEVVEAKTIAVDTDTELNDLSNVFKFCPTETGYYNIITQDESYNYLSIRYKNEYDQFVEYSNYISMNDGYYRRNIEAYFEAGNEYIIDYECDEITDNSIRITFLTNPSIDDVNGFMLSSGKKIGYVCEGSEGRFEKILLDFNPGVVSRHNSLTATTSDPNIVDVAVVDDNYILLDYMQASNEPVEITVRVNDTFDVQLSVAVAPISSIVPEEPELVVNKGSYYFIPEESGFYGIGTFNTNPDDGSLEYIHTINITYYDEYGNAITENVAMIENEDIYEEKYFEEGVKYWIDTAYNGDGSWFNDSTGSYELMIVKLSLPTEAQLMDDDSKHISDTISSMVNSSMLIRIDYGSDIHICKNFNDVNWSIDDESVASLDTLGSFGTWIYFLSPGETTLTATINDNIVLTVNIIVENAPSIGVNVPMFVDGYKIFSFVPEETGIYSISTSDSFSYDESEFHHFIYVDGELGEGQSVYTDIDAPWFSTEAYGEVRLEEGKEYLIKAYFNDYYDDYSDSPGTFNVTISKLEAPESISINDMGDLFAGLENLIRLSCEGDNCAKFANEIIWSSDDENVIYFDEFGYAHYKNPGIATIKAELANDSKVSASKTVRVKGPKEITLDETIGGRDKSAFIFTPNVSGVYQFTIDNVVPEKRPYYIWEDITPCEYNGEYGYLESFNNSENVIEAKLQANKPYILTVYFLPDDYCKCENGTYDVTVKKLKNPTSAIITVDPDGIPYVGFDTSYSLDFLNDGEIKYHNNVDLSVEDMSIAEIAGEDGNRIAIHCNNPGTTKLIVKVNGSLTLEKEINVRDDMYPISVGETVSFKSNEGTTMFKFSPEESGYYSLYYDCPTKLNVENVIVFDADYTELFETGTSDFYYYEGGQDYYVFTYCPKKGINCALSAKEQKVPVDFSIIKSPDKTEYARNNVTGLYAEDNINDLTGMVVEVTWSDGSITKRRITSIYADVEGYILASQHVVVDGQDKMAVWFQFDDGSSSESKTFDITLGDSPVTDIKVLSQTPILDSMSYESNGIKYYTDFDANYFLLEIHEGDKVYTNELSPCYPDTPADVSDWISYNGVVFGCYDENGNFVLSDYPPECGQKLNPWSVGGENNIYIIYKGYAVPYNVEIIDDPYIAMDVLSVPTNTYYFNENFNYNQKYSEMSGFWEAGVPSIRLPLDGLTLRLYKKGYDEKTNPTAYDDYDISGLWSYEQDRLNGYQLNISPSDMSLFYSDASAQFDVDYMGLHSTFELKNETKNVAEVEVIEQPDITLYLDDNSIFEIIEEYGETYIYYHPKLSMLEGMKFRYKYEDGTYSKTFVLPNLGDTEDAVFDGQYFGYFRTNFAFSREEALYQDTIYFVFENELIPVKVHVEAEKQVKGFVVDSEDELSTVVSADSKESAINTALNDLDDSQIAAVAAGSVLTTNVSVKTASEETDYEGMLEIAELDNQEVAMKLSIGVSYNIDGGEDVDIHETENEIAITIEIPEELRGRKSYKVYREHNGKIDTIEPAISADGKYLTFKSDKFSEYAVSGEKSSILGSVFGEVSCFNSNHQLIVELIKDDEVKYRTTVVPENVIGKQTQVFEIADVAPGIYDLVVIKENHLKFTAKNIEVGKDGLDLRTNDNYSELNIIELLCGDINSDGRIDSQDRDILWSDENYLKSITDCTDVSADLDGSGVINEYDLNILWNDANYNKTEEDCIVIY